LQRGLLQNFRELGIEIHNAYGMTEAPLVTLNRLGAIAWGL
jgi:long-chain acyl-CoA synthetase